MMFKKRSNSNDDAVLAAEKELQGLQTKREALAERLAKAHQDVDDAMDARREVVLNNWNDHAAVQAANDRVTEATNLEFGLEDVLEKLDSDITIAETKLAEARDQAEREAEVELRRGQLAYLQEVIPPYLSAAAKLEAAIREAQRAETAEQGTRTEAPDHHSSPIDKLPNAKCAYSSVHEAAHAVVARAFNHPVAGALVHENGGGKMWHYDKSDQPTSGKAEKVIATLQPAERDGFFPIAVTLLAAGLATKRCGLSWEARARGCGSDWDTATRIIRGISTSAEGKRSYSSQLSQKRKNF